MNITFGGNKVTLAGKEIKVGDKAPEFVAVKNDLSVFDSKENEGKVVVYSVAPSIDTPVCSLQTRTFNEEAAELRDDIAIVTITVDLPFAQARFCANEGIDKTIIVSDYKDHDFGTKYGFLMNENHLLARGIVVVDKEGIVQYVEYVPEVTNEVNFEKALEKVKSL
ncbi:thiol peroxidase [Peptoniphilus stercorisuis]|uniref:Thiol peroxidase n=1 Tax=Peptoniphilus stercorisuis TaxID=1436965 RepID=A0ABS4KCQ0_9FIRM|nr:thiol peroxidase [Peptoniphilus stercorisuis]MBP2025532.1 thiol peroxidase [Peptoniphilus stercorisuis]